MGDQFNYQRLIYALSDYIPDHMFQKLKSMKVFILGFLLVSIAYSYTYNIQSVSECLTYDSTHGVCSKWSQTGTIQQDTPSCFIGETLVKQQTKGFIEMKDIQVGDRILTYKNGQQKWSQVQGWLHKNQQIKASYNKVTLQTGEWIGVTGKHNIAFQTQSGNYEYGFSIDSKQDTKLYPISSKVMSIQSLVSYGMYSPLTSESSYLVYPSKNSEGILAHDFANIRNPQAYEPIARTILGTSKIINGGHLLNAEGMNVAADWMMDNFSFLME